MKYSIIIPTLNEEKLLPNLLKQLTEKKFREKFEVEVIVSDGASRDKTVEFAKNYADLVIVHSEQRRQNIAEGRNKGFEASSGDILVFFNGDILLPDPEEFFTYIQNNFINSDYLAMTCYVKVFPHESKLVDKFFHAIYNRYFRLINYFGIGMGRGECHVLRRDLFIKMNGYNQSLAAGEDFDLYKRIRRLGKILFSKDICVYESPRRFRKLGYLSVSWIWIRNGFSVFFKDKAISREWIQVR